MAEAGGAIASAKAAICFKLRLHRIYAALGGRSVNQPQKRLYHDLVELLLTVVYFGCFSGEHGNREECLKRRCAGLILMKARFQNYLQYLIVPHKKKMWVVQHRSGAGGGWEVIWRVFLGEEGREM